jgi:hypothetical protein
MGEYYNRLKKKKHFQPIMAFWVHGLTNFVPCSPFYIIEGSNLYPLFCDDDT